MLAVGDTETASSAHVVTQAEFDAGTLINIATADGDSPLGVNVRDTDTQTVTFAQNPAIDVVKSQALTTDNNLNGLPDVGDTVTYGYTVENTGDVTLSNVALVDDLEGTLVLSDVARDDVPVLAPGNSETASSAHTLTQAGRGIQADYVALPVLELGVDCFFACALGEQEVNIQLTLGGLLPKSPRFKRKYS